MVLSSGSTCGAQWFGRAAIVAFVVFLSMGAMAQTITSTPNVNISPSLVTHYNSCVAINPANPKNVACFSALTLATGGLFSGVSTNGGASFTPGQIADGTSALPVAAGSPSCSWDTFGNLFVAYQEISGNKIVVLLSTDGGRTFSLLKVFNGVGLSQPKIATGPDFNGGGGSVWLAYYDATNKSVFTTGALVDSISVVEAFAVAQGIGGTTGAVIGDIAVGSIGEVVVSYQIGTAQGPSTIFTAFDDDGLGPDTFLVNGAAATPNVGTAEPIPAQNARGINASASIAFDQNAGTLYIAYVDENPAGSGDTNIFVDSSDDDGATWNGAVQVNDDLGVTSQFLPHIAVDQFFGNVAVTYYGCQHDLGDNGVGDTDGIPNDDAQVFMSASLDGGATFLANSQLSGGTSNAAKADAANGSNTDFGAYIGLAYVNGNIVATWSDNSNSTADNPSGSLSQLNLYTAVAQVVTPPTVAPDPTMLPDLVVTDIELTGNPIAGFPFTFVATIMNSGVGDAAPFYVSAFSDPSIVGFHKSTQTDFSVPDPSNPNKVDVQYVPGLAAGASVDVVLTMLYNVPGDVTLALSADSQSNITESNELNNVLTQRELVLSVGTDIAVRSDINSGSPAMVATITNTIASAAEAATTVTITLNNLQFFLPGQQVIVSGVGAGYDGQFTILTVTNTTFTYTATVAGLLPATPANGIASLVPGFNAHFDYTLINLGNLQTGPFQVGFYNSRAVAPNAGDVPDQTFTVPNMLPGDVLQLSFDLPTQNVARGGRAWVFADWQNVVAESVETNNTGSAVWGVPNDAPAILSPVTASSQTVQAGDVVTFSVGAGDPDGDTVFYVWDFGDGTGPTPGGSTITHVYAAPGIFTATVTVSDGPFTNVQSKVSITVLDSIKIDLGFVVAKAGYIKLAVPLPPGVTKKDRAKATIFQGSPGIDVKFRNQLLTGKPSPAAVAPGTAVTYTFTVEYLAPKGRFVKYVRYQYVVLY